MLRRKVLIKAVCGVLLISGLHLGTQIQSAHAACFAHSCDGQSPFSQGCGADAYNLGQPVSGDSLYVDMRYSPTCVARWSRTVYNTTPPGGGEWYRTYINWYPYGGGNIYDTPSIANNYGQQIVSPMRGVDAAKGCGQRGNIYRAALCTSPA